MEKKIRNVAAYVGAVLTFVALVFLFGTVGAIEHGTTTFADNRIGLVSYLFVLFVGALLTNVRGEEE